MTYRQSLVERLLFHLDVKLSELGFKRRKSRRPQTFYRMTPNGKEFFHVSFIPHQEDFDITAHVAVRNESLEDLVNEFNTDLSKEKEKSETTTAGTELGNISIGRQHRWTIVDEKDVERVCNSILEEFKTVGLPYLQRFSSVKEILDVLSSDTKEAWLHCPFHDTRAKKAIAAAFILGRKDIFLDLIELKTQYLKGRAERFPQEELGFQAFISFAEWLTKRWADYHQKA